LNQKQLKLGEELQDQKLQQEKQANEYKTELEKVNKQLESSKDTLS